MNWVPVPHYQNSPAWMMRLTCGHTQVACPVPRQSGRYHPPDDIRCSSCKLKTTWTQAIELPVTT